jgi:hypothetical protein
VVVALRHLGLIPSQPFRRLANATAKLEAILGESLQGKLLRCDGGGELRELVMKLTGPGPSTPAEKELPFRCVWILGDLSNRPG